MDRPELNWARLKVRVLPQTRDERVIFGTVLLVFGLTILLPMMQIFHLSFYSKWPTTEETYYTLDNYQELFLSGDTVLIEITKNTLIFATGEVILAFGIGLTAAILSEKYIDTTKVDLFILLPYAMPAVAGVTGWIYLVGNSGVVNTVLMDFFNLQDPPINIYSMGGMIVVSAMHAAPLAYILISPGLRSVAAEVEEASHIAGASRLLTLRKIVLPLIGPALVSIFIFLFARALALVTVPTILGLPARIFTYGPAIPFLFLAGGRLAYDQAMAFAVYLTVISAILMYIYFKYTSKEDKYTTITGKGQARTKKYEVSRTKKYLAHAFIGGYVVIAGILPLIAIFYDSIIPGYDFLEVQRITFQHYIALFSGNADGVRAWWRSFNNTLIIGAVVPTIAIVIAGFISYSNQLLDIPLSKTVAYLSSVPLAIPSIALGLGIMVLFIQTPIYGTIAILVVGFVGKAIPVAMRYTSPALLKIGRENIEASALSGYHEIRTFKEIIFPLASSDFIAGWMHIFVYTVRNVPIAILLYAAGSEVIAVELLFLIRRAKFKSASTMAVVLTLFSMIPYLALQWYRIQNRDSLAEAE